MASCNHTVATTLATAIDHLGQALQALEQAQNAAQDVRVAALYEAAKDMMCDTTAEHAVWAADTGIQSDEHVRTWERQAYDTGVQSDYHTLTFRDGQTADKLRLIDQAKALGIRACRSWKLATLTAKIAAAKVAKPTTTAPATPEPTATARMILAPCAAQVTTEPAPDAERAELMAKLATLSTHELRDLVALAFPATKVT